MKLSRIAELINFQYKIKNSGGFRASAFYVRRSFVHFCIVYFYTLVLIPIYPLYKKQPDNRTTFHMGEIRGVEPCPPDGRTQERITTVVFVCVSGVLAHSFSSRYINTINKTARRADCFINWWR